MHPVIVIFVVVVNLTEQTVAILNSGTKETRFMKIRCDNGENYEFLLYTVARRFALCETVPNVLCSKWQREIMGPA